jgi:hypothetical protein
MTRHFSGLAAFTLIVSLAGCGGGSSGGSDSPGGSSTTFSADTTSATVTVDPTATEPAVAVALTVRNPPAAGFYYGFAINGAAVHDVNISWDPAPTNGVLNGSAVLVLYRPGLMGSGTYDGTAILQACVDAACSHPFSGNPQSVQVHYTVTGNAVSDESHLMMPTSLELESASSDGQLTGAVGVTAYDVPPYGEHISLQSLNGTAIEQLSVSGAVAANTSGTSTVNVKMKTPAVLGPGSYQDGVIISICYDANCSKQAIGSPWTVPIRYGVTASAGREFQQRFIAMPATVLASNPARTFLYIGTRDLNAADPYQFLRLDPSSGAVTGTLSMPGAPLLIAVTPDGQYAYVVTETFANERALVRVRLADMAIDLNSPLGYSGETPTDLQVSPVDTHAVALAYAFLDNVAGSQRTVRILDDGAPRANAFTTDNSSIYLASVQWNASGSGLYLNDRSLFKGVVDANGLGPLTAIRTNTFGDGLYNAAIHLVGTRLFGEGGVVLDPEANTMLGTLSFRTPLSASTSPYAALLPDPSTGRVFAMFYDNISTKIQITLASYDLNSLAPIGYTRVEGVRGGLARWGTNGLAYITTAPSQPGVLLINGSFVGP